MRRRRAISVPAPSRLSCASYFLSPRPASRLVPSWDPLACGTPHRVVLELEHEDGHELSPGGCIVVSLGRFLSGHDQLLARNRSIGVRLVNSDDPAYFGGYVNANFIAAADALNLTRDEVLTLARNSFTGSFLPPAEQAMYLAAIDSFATTY